MRPCLGVEGQEDEVSVSLEVAPLSIEQGLVGEVEHGLGL